MIDLNQKQLSEAIFLIGKEINRGAWLVDRMGGANGGIGCKMPEAVKIVAVVTARPGEVLVESVATEILGAQTNKTTEAGSQSQAGNQLTTQGGENGQITTNTYGEVT